MIKYHIKTFGCAMNHSDSERIATFLESRGFMLSEKIDDANLIVINTCGVRQAAENRVYSLVNNLTKNNIQKSKAKNLKPKTLHLAPRIVITGCISHRKDVQKRLKNKIDLFFSINNFHEFENWTFENCLEIRNSKLEIPIQNNIPDKENIAYFSINPKHTNSFEAFVPIMTGCDNFCSYCVVPYARGREVSRPADEIVTEVRDLVSKGYKMITLLGQNVNSYKSQVHKVYKVRNVNKERIEEINFTKLLKKINTIPGKFWVTFVSSHPKDMSDELIETIAKCKKICEWVHLPVQAGNDEILKRMNRKYTQAHYLKLIKKIRNAFAKIRGPLVPIGVSTDIIVGFPGETRIQFADSAKVMEEAKYDMVYFGQFSPRPGTAAWDMKDNVSKKEKERREKVLNEILKKTALANNRKYVGKVIEVLVEKHVITKAGLLGSQSPALRSHAYFGKTRTMKNIKILSQKKILVGSFVKVAVTKANVWNLEGTAI